MQFVVVSKGVHLEGCSVLKLGVDRNVGLDKEGLVVVMYVGVGLVIGLQNKIGVVVGKSVGAFVSKGGGPTQTAISEQEISC